jgi:small conductance mechanosensitive channel
MFTWLDASLHAVSAAEDEPPPPECDQGASFICERVLDWTDGNEDLARFADAAVGVIAILLLAWVITRIIKRYVARILRQIIYPDHGMLREGLKNVGLDAITPDDVTADDDRRRAAEEARRAARMTSISKVITSTANVAVWVIAGLLVLEELGVNIGPLLAGAGITAAALSFGAQSMIKDMIAGLFILIEDQYGIGDVIDLGEAVGTVEKISFRATRLRGLDGTVWHVSNGIPERVGNFSKLWSVALVDVDVAYDSDLTAAGEIILRTAEEVVAGPEWVDDIVEPPTLLGVETLGADGITLRLLTKVRPGVHWGLQRAMRLAIKDALDDAGVEIPFPQRTVWVRGGES